MKKRKRSKKSQSSKKKIINKAQYNSITKKIYLFFGLVFSLFIFLCCINKLGIVGSIVRNIILMLFGTFGYFFPIYIIIACLFSYYEVSTIRKFLLFLFYVFLSSTISIFVSNPEYNIKLISLITSNKIPESFSFVENEYSNGIINYVINYVIYKWTANLGLYFFNILFCFITLLFSFGINSITAFTSLIKNIIFFIPNYINKINASISEDRQIEYENELELNKAIQKLKSNKNLSNENDKHFDVLDDEQDKSINKFENKKFDTLTTYDTSNVHISAKEIQSRFYNQSSNSTIDDENKNNLELDKKEEIRKQIREKSINEIYNNNRIKPNDLFYSKNNRVNDEVNIDDALYDENNTNIRIQDNFNYDNKDIPNLIDDYNQNDDSINETLKNIEDNEKIIHDDNSQVNRITPKKIKKIYKFPPLAYLNKSIVKKSADKNYINEKAKTLQNTLSQFGVGAKVTNVSVGPTVTRFELLPDLGVRVKKILDLQDDIKLALAATEIRIEAPIPGKSAIGIEVPNKETNSVLLGDILSTNEYKQIKSKLKVAIGRDITGQIITCDIAKMPHLLVAGSTGSGKSVCINSIIMSIIYNSTPEDVRLIMVDPKVVELQIYNDIPHLLIPVVTDPKKAAAALNWAVGEMMRRYNLIVEKQFRDIDKYNEYVEIENKKIDNEEDKLEKLPKIVIIIDEFADLMTVASKDVENAIFRIAQLARACGIHLIIATQRPSVNVISGSIKANVPGRIAFSVSSGVDSKTILDQYGAEKLLGKGDMLYSPSGLPKPIRVQGCFVSDTEIKKVVEFIKDPNVEFDYEIQNSIDNAKLLDDTKVNDNNSGRDELFVSAGKLILSSNMASSGFLQRKLQIGFNRASRILDQLAEEHVVSEQDGKKSREILMTIDEFIEKYGN